MEEHPGSEIVVSLFEVEASPSSVAAFIEREHEFRCASPPVARLPSCSRSHPSFMGWGGLCGADGCRALWVHSQAGVRTGDVASTPCIFTHSPVATCAPLRNAHAHTQCRQAGTEAQADVLRAATPWHWLVQANPADVTRNSPGDGPHATACPPLLSGSWRSSRCTLTAAHPWGALRSCAPGGTTTRTAGGAAPRTSGSAGMASTALSASGREPFTDSQFLGEGR